MGEMEHNISLESPENKNLVFTPTAMRLFSSQCSRKFGHYSILCWLASYMQITHVILRKITESMNEPTRPQHHTSPEDTNADWLSVAEVQIFLNSRKKAYDAKSCHPLHSRHLICFVSITPPDMNFVSSCTLHVTHSSNLFYFSLVWTQH